MTSMRGASSFLAPRAHQERRIVSAGTLSLALGDEDSTPVIEQLVC